METMAGPKEKLYNKIADFLYGVYEPVDEKEYQKCLESFRNFITKWKIDLFTQKTHGPLLPAEMYKRIYSISEQDAKKIAESINLRLPESLSLQRYNLDSCSDDDFQEMLEQIETSEDPEEIILDVLTSREDFEKEEKLELFEPKKFDYLDITAKDYRFKNIPSDTHNKIKQISFLQNIIEQIKSGEVVKLTAVTLQSNGKTKLWLPIHLSDSEIEEYYNPIIELLTKVQEDEELPN